MKLISILVLLFALLAFVTSAQKPKKGGKTEKKADKKAAKAGKKANKKAAGKGKKKSL